uniref:CACTA en-spm transposon protein n=1 Tax=Panagrellus redivivus TaxID=6233 RepID=A0A7E4V120_PANRE
MTANTTISEASTKATDLEGSFVTAFNFEFKLREMQMTMEKKRVYLQVTRRKRPTKVGFLPSVYADSSFLQNTMYNGICRDSEVPQFEPCKTFSKNA